MLDIGALTASGSGVVDAVGGVVAGLTLTRVLTVVVLVVICVIVVKILLRLVNRFLEKGKVDPSLHGFIRAAARIILWFLAIIIIAGSLGVNIASLVAILGVAGLALSLAIQGALSNLAGGVQVLMAKPFKVGDYVATNGVEGTVQEINMVNTKIRTNDNKIVFVPNSELAAAKVTNYTTEEMRRVDHVFGAAYDCDIDKVKDCILRVLQSHPKILQDPAPFARVSNYGANQIEYAVRAWCRTGDYWDVYFDLLEQVKRAFDAEGIEMSYDNVNVHIVKD